MLGLFRNLLGQPTPLAESNPRQRRELATCVLILEVANADGECSDEERNHIIQTLGKRFSLDESQVYDLLEAAHELRAKSLDLWRFTSTINESFTHPEKQELLREVWRVVYADGYLDAHEDHLMHKLGRLLNLNHPQLIEGKLAVLKELRANE